MGGGRIGSIVVFSFKCKDFHQAEALTLTPVRASMVFDLAVLDARFGVLAGIDGRAKSGAPYKRGNEQSSLHGCSWISIGEKANKAGA